MKTFDPQPFIEHAILIESTKTLETFLEGCTNAPVIGVDTESAGFFKYRGVVNLIQVCTPTQAALIDPQMISDMSPLLRFAEQTNCEWLFHGGDYDAKILFRDFQVHVRRLFDTQIAAAILGLRELGLSSLSERYLGFSLDKKLQRCDWSRRPMTNAMKTYAILDAICLLPLREALIKDLTKKKRLEWVQEECSSLAEEIAGSNPAKPEGKPFAFFIKGARVLSPRGLAVLREIWEEREHIAAELDRAAFMVIGNTQLLEVARIAPQTMAGLSVIKGINEHFLHRYGRKFLEAIKKGMEAETTNLRPPPRFPLKQNYLSSWEGQISGTLRDVRNAVAAKIELPGALLASGEALEVLSHDRPTSVEELHAHGALRHWQVDLLAESFLAVLKQPPPAGSSRARARRRR